MMEVDLTHFAREEIADLVVAAIHEICDDWQVLYEFDKQALRTRLEALDEICDKIAELDSLSSYFNNYFLEMSHKWEVFCLENILLGNFHLIKLD